MTSEKVINAPIEGAQINDLHFTIAPEGGRPERWHKPWVIDPWGKRKRRFSLPVEWKAAHGLFM